MPLNVIEVNTAPLLSPYPDLEEIVRIIIPEWNNILIIPTITVEVRKLPEFINFFDPD